MTTELLNLDIYSNLFLKKCLFLLSSCFLFYILMTTELLNLDIRTKLFSKNVWLC